MLGILAPFSKCNFFLEVQLLGGIRTSLPFQVGEFMEIDSSLDPPSNDIHFSIFVFHIIFLFYFVLNLSIIFFPSCEDSERKTSS